MSERESQVLTVVVSSASNQACTVTLELQALNFDFSPTEPRRTLTLTPAQPTVESAWIISPKTSGRFEIGVSTGIDYRIVGIAVTSVLGLSSRQAEVLKYVAGLLGPMLTVPWWYEKWRERKSRTPSKTRRRR